MANTGNINNPLLYFFIIVFMIIRINS
jgi:hypothetical protein